MECMTCSALTQGKAICRACAITYVDELDLPVRIVEKEVLIEREVLVEVPVLHKPPEVVRKKVVRIRPPGRPKEENAYWNWYVQALRRGETDIRYADWLSLKARSCFLCGETSKITLDRINSSIGYMLDNVQPLCLRCNTMKWDMPMDVFLGHIQRIISYSNPSHG